MNGLPEQAQTRSEPRPGALPLPAPVWQVSTTPVPYPEAIARMDALVAEIAAGRAPERLWLLEHPPVITAGTSADMRDLLDPTLPVVRSGRGGRFTWHGPGQRVVYVMLNLARRGRDVHSLVAAIEDWVIAALASLGIPAHRSARGTGVWVASPDPAGEAKVAAVGLRVRRWVSFHGVALNVSPDLAAFAGFVPCGIADARPARLVDIDPAIDMRALDTALACSVDRLLARIGRGGLEAPAIPG